jgi:hypothetical protein
VIIQGSLFGRFLYGLAIVCVVMITMFYIKLSQLSENKLEAGGYIGFTLWVDFCFWLFLIYASITTYKYSVFEEQFSQSPQFGRFIDKIVSMTIPMMTVIMIILEWP